MSDDAWDDDTSAQVSCLEVYYSRQVPHLPCYLILHRQLVVLAVDLEVMLDSHLDVALEGVEVAEEALAVVSAFIVCATECVCPLNLAADQLAIVCCPNLSDLRLSMW